MNVSFDLETPLPELPIEIWRSIIQMSSCHDAVNLRRVCREWYQICGDYFGFQPGKPEIRRLAVLLQNGVILMEETFQTVSHSKHMNRFHLETHLTMHKRHLADMLNSRGDTLLHAAIRPTSDILEFLLGLNVLNVNSKNNNGNSPLLEASMHSNHPDGEKNVEMLLKAGADVNLQNECGCTPLMAAARNSGRSSTERTVEMLLRAGSDVNLQTKDGWTSLMVAARHSGRSSTERTVEMLLRAGSDVNLQTKEGLTPLMMAAHNSGGDSTEDTVRMLLRAGSNVKLTDVNNLTAYMFAAFDFDSKSTKETIEMLSKVMNRKSR